MAHETLKQHKVQFYRGNGSPLRSVKVRPNDPCPCGSGKKVKNCCGVKTKYYHSEQFTKGGEA